MNHTAHIKYLGTIVGWHLLRRKSLELRMRYLWDGNHGGGYRPLEYVAKDKEFHYICITFVNCHSEHKQCQFSKTCSRQF